MYSSLCKMRYGSTYWYVAKFCFVLQSTNRIRYIVHNDKMKKERHSSSWWIDHTVEFKRRERKAGCKKRSEYPIECVHGIVEVECGSLHLGHYNNQLVLWSSLLPFRRCHKNINWSPFIDIFTVCYLFNNLSKKLYRFPHLFTFPWWLFV